MFDGDDFDQDRLSRLEKELLVGFVYSAEIADRFLDELSEWNFTDRSNRIIYNALLKLRDDKSSIDLKTVKNELKRRDLLLPEDYAFLESDDFKRERDMDPSEAESYVSIFRNSIMKIRRTVEYAKERFPRFVKSFIEQGLLVGFVYNPQQTKGVFVQTKRSDFYYKNHKIIFDEIQDLLRRHEEIDINLLLNRLDYIAADERLKPEDYAFLTGSQFNACRKMSFNLAKTYIEELRNCSAIRILSYKADEMVDIVCEPSSALRPEEAIAMADKHMQDIDEISAIELGTTSTLQASVSEVIKKLKDSGSTMEKTIPSGYKALDKITGGFHPGLAVLAGRPQMGASEFAMNLALNMSKDHKVLYFLTYDTHEAFTTKALRMLAQTPHSRYSVGAVKMERFRAAARQLQNHRLTIDALKSDKKNISRMALEKIIALSKYAFSKRPEIIIVDDIWNVDVNPKIAYRRPRTLQEKEITHSERNSGWYRESKEFVYVENREEKRLNTVAYSLYVVANSLHIPVIAVTGCKGEVDDRKSGIPRLGDVQGSLSTEVANLVLLFHRPMQYTIPLRRKVPEKEPINLIVARNRKGPAPKRAKLIYHSEYFAFEDSSK
ncbi:hypothetical protein GF371_04150 [Candidatus Woesearchaeota archaeon]|nr:hypothetical protein [Candidatus Woesearchaeota archaeon]